MISSSFLSTGDTISIVATARKVTSDEMRPAISFLEESGFRVVCGKNLYEAHRQFAGTDEQRAEDLQWAINQPEIKAILIARGGYGTMRILDLVDFSPLKTNPKWICGYSDVTALHQHVQTFLNLTTIHCTMPINFEKNIEARESLVHALQGKLHQYVWESDTMNRSGKAEGILVGGNLSLLYALTGTASDLNTEGKILFIEDLDEYLYHVDRMMMSLRMAGKLKNLKGLIVGGLSEMKDNAIPFGKTAAEIVLDAVKDYSFPVSFCFPAGHIERNLALYLGRKVEFSTGSQGSQLIFK
jgi:muramoyltetrapeptide carboxypeptidase